MFRNYLKIALRNLKRHKGFSLINISGLSIGIACFILIMLYVQHEFSFDTFHEKADRIYRITTHDLAFYSDREVSFAGTPGPFAPLLMSEYPEIIHATRIKDAREKLIRYRNKSFYEEGLYTDEQFLNIFTFPLIHGDKKTALSDPFSIVISEKLASKLFKDEDPIGKVVHYNGQFDVTITGIFAEIPGNSHLRFDYLISTATLARTYTFKNPLTRWDSSGFFTYIEFREDSSPTEFDSKIYAIYEKYSAGRIKFVKKVKRKHPLQHLKDIHLKSHFEYDIALTNDTTYLYLLSLIAFLILVIACINYMNLSTARSSKRAIEVGIRKTVGAHRRQITKQFISESIFLSVIALLLSILIVELFLPSFNSFVGKNIEINHLENWKFAIILLGIILFVGIFSGSYPALFLSSFQPVKVLKGTGRASPKGLNLRNALVVMQFGVSIILIIGTIIIFSQMDYIQNMKLGYEREQVVIIPVKDKEALKSYKIIKEELIKDSQVVGVTVSDTVLTEDPFGTDAYTEGKNGEKLYIEHINQIYVDHDFLDVYEIDVISGRNFSKKFRTDKEKAILLNETAAKQVGWKDPIGKRFSKWHIQNGRVIGVVKDFHYDSLHHKIEPLMLMLTPAEESYEGSFKGIGDLYFSVRIKPDNIQNTLTFLKVTFEKYNLNHPFHYQFLDDLFTRLYETEQKQGFIILYSSFLAIFVACLGLSGLAAFAAELRIKEVGIRKVMGASISKIVIMLSKEFTKWVIIANLFAWPISYYAMNKWLQNFAYRIEIGLWMFLLAGTLALMIALLTVSHQAIRAATTNPAEALRYE